jgi:hypothetical protein
MDSPSCFSAIDIPSPSPPHHTLVFPKSSLTRCVTLCRAAPAMLTIDGPAAREPAGGASPLRRPATSSSRCGASGCPNSSRERTPKEKEVKTGASSLGTAFPLPNEPPDGCFSETERERARARPSSRALVSKRPPLTARGGRPTDIPPLTRGRRCDTCLDGAHHGS